MRYSVYSWEYSRSVCISDVQGKQVYEKDQAAAL
jgi:hypothetical protein